MRSYDSPNIDPMLLHVPRYKLGRIDHHAQQNWLVSMRIVNDKSHSLLKIAMRCEGDYWFGYNLIDDNPHKY